ncbi:metal ABC transporter solute-binding protein, Zn/Mn family [Magnetovibrio blakemorei]|uniref:metal ABC transporter solute-binding protein, Zn/Mn family n=1 Tax=Magnetovibrio blakemorei TaxID=28181 RepID=UPI0009FC2AD4|nr:zinc ABC transporter substrate-binding protein [Magnetovibrio blakemorei]
MTTRLLRTRILPFLGAILSLFLSLSEARASDRVVVSVPPLHSLVSYLLAGVDQPALLFTDPSHNQETVPMPTALSKIHAAKMVVWVGPTYEKPLAGLFSIDPATTLKGLTLSSSLPLLGAPDAQHPSRSNGVQDMRFWLDPRLAKVAVSRIAPNLTRVYPDHVELILDNEIALKKRLTDMEHQFRHVLGTPHGVPLNVPESDVLYLAWRFNLATPTCPDAAQKIEGFDGTPGAKDYFKMMDAILSDLKACQI